TVTVPSTATLNPTAGLTLEAWVNPQSYNGWGGFIGKAYGSTNQYLLRNYSNTGRVDFEVYTGTAWQICTTGVSDVTPIGTWTHVAATYDGATMLIYLNGVQKCSFATTGAIATGSAPLYLGRGYYSWETYNG